MRRPIRYVGFTRTLGDNRLTVLLLGDAAEEKGALRRRCLAEIERWGVVTGRSADHRRHEVQHLKVVNLSTALLNLEHRTALARWLRVVRTRPTLERARRHMRAALKAAR